MKEKKNKKLACKFVRIIPDEKDFDFDVEIGKNIITLLNQLKKSLIDKISKRLLELEFNSNHSIITKALKGVVKNVLPSLQNMIQNVKKAGLVVLVVRILHTILKKTKK